MENPIYPCPKCGKEKEPKSKFCYNCGYEYRNVSEHYYLYKDIRHKRKIRVLFTILSICLTSVPLSIFGIPYWMSFSTVFAIVCVFILFRRVCYVIYLKKYPEKETYRPIPLFRE